MELLGAKKHSTTNKRAKTRKIKLATEVQPISITIALAGVLILPPLHYNHNESPKYKNELVYSLFLGDYLVFK
jgi:hypothetical protein